jgi:hypothetical protein
MDIDEKGAASGLRYWSEPDNRHEVALYITQQRTWERPWVSLTDEDRDGFVQKYWNDELTTMRSMMKDVEAKLKEKNT